MLNQKDKDIEEMVEVCSKALMSWFFRESKGGDPCQHELWKDLFTGQVLHKKLEVFDIDIVIPDELYALIGICSNENPGRCQLILKELLSSIYHKRGPIPNGYVITSTDFSLCYPMEFPIEGISEDSEKRFREMWENQKVEGYDGRGSDNRCDTVAWWKEVMKEK